MTRRATPAQSRGSSSGQASIVLLGLVACAVVLGTILVAIAHVYLAQGQAQQAADIAAASLSMGADQEFRDDARELAKSNGAESVEFSSGPDGRTKVTTHLTAAPVARLLGSTTVKATALGPMPQAFGDPTSARGAHGSAYSGPLVAVDSTSVCPAVARDYKAMQAAASGSGVHLRAISGYRGHAEQAQLYALLGPGLAAPPGTSLHHAATELDLAVGPAGSPTHTWLTRNAGRFHFNQRYSWEPWHWGNVQGC